MQSYRAGYEKHSLENKQWYSSPRRRQVIRGQIHVPEVRLVHDREGWMDVEKVLLHKFVEGRSGRELEGAAQF